MSDRTRRLICRTLFLVGCVLPTLAVGAWSAASASASHRDECARQLSQSLGLRASIGGVSYPRPGVTLYSAVELADQETAAPIARMRFLEVGGGQGIVGIVASQAELDAAVLGQLWPLVKSQLTAAGDRAMTDRAVVDLSAREVTLHLPTGSQTLVDVHGQIDGVAKTGERSATISFRLAGVDTAEPIRLRAARKITAGHVATTVEIQTAGAAVPCWLLLGTLGIENHLGERAQFRGALWASETADGWDGELSGQLTNVDLDRAVTEQFPHQLSGRATVTIEKARFHAGRLEEATGSVTSGPGLIDAPFLAAAAEHLKLTRLDATAPTSAGALAAADDPIQFDQFAMSFAIDSTSVTLRGQCSEAPGAILCRGPSPLLVDGGGTATPVVALLRTLAPQSQLQVPATRESDWLIHCLPVPQIVAPLGATPHGKLRLSGKEPGT